MLPKLVTCTECEGAGCTHCDGLGRLKIPCVRKGIDSSVVMALRATDWADDGYLVVRGGMYDQAASFVAAREFIRRERRQWEHYMADQKNQKGR